METLEEAADKYSKELTQVVAFFEGAKWMQDNSNINALDFEIDALKREIKVLKHIQERMYSEDEVLILLRKAHFVEQNIEEWFEQFKKK